MPYITPERRNDIEENVDAPQSAGDLNYVITRLVGQYVLKKGKTYGTLNEVIGVLECAKLELYRRVAAEYEDTKCKLNGDIPEYIGLSKGIN